MAKITPCFGMKSLLFLCKYCTIDIEIKTIEKSGFSWNSLVNNNLYCQSNLTIMENESYLTWLIQDVEAWNHWRKGNCEQIDLAGIQLKGACLRRALLSSVDLSESNLRRADLRRAFLCDASLSKADLTETDLSRASLAGANLRKANLARTSLKWACLIGADLTEANLEGADLTGADLTDAKLTKANLTGANLTGADLTGASLIDVQACSTNFQGAIFTGACLEDWQVDKTTQLNELMGDYIYLKSERRSRFPSNGSFALGEINQLLQKIVSKIEPLGTQETAD
jgi:uncharacterized protein YjbI with pentapeptide repeats